MKDIRVHGTLIFNLWDWFLNHMYIRTFMTHAYNNFQLMTSQSEAPVSYTAQRNTLRTWGFFASLYSIYEMAIFHIGTSGHMWTIHMLFRWWNPSQKSPVSYTAPTKTLRTAGFFTPLYSIYENYHYIFNISTSGHIWPIHMLFRWRSSSQEASVSSTAQERL